MAKSVMFPGSNTVIMNLLNSYQSAEPIKASADGDDEWSQEYRQGCDWEIYLSDLPSIFEGAMFTKLSYILYDRLNIVLIGITIRKVDAQVEPNVPPKLILNPLDFVIPKFAEYTMQAVLIAKDLQDADISYFEESASDPDRLKETLGPGKRMLKTARSFSRDGRDQSLSKMPSASFNRQPSLSSANSGFFLQSQSSALFQQDSERDKARKECMKGLKFEALDEHSNNDDREENSGRVAGGNGHGHDKPEKPAPAVRPGNRRRLDIKTLVTQLETVKKNQMSKQETQKDAEDKFTKDNFYCRPAKCDASDVTIMTSVDQEASHIHDHVIIIGLGLSNIIDLIRPLRLKSLGSLKYIVLLFPDDVPTNLWQRISLYDGIFIVRGSALEEENLRRAGIFRAAQVVILADSSQGSLTQTSIDQAVAGLEALEDSNSIFTFKAVKRMNDRTHIVVEFVRDTNIEYLRGHDHGKTIADNYRESPMFASGSLFTSSLLDSMVSQTLFNPCIIEVVKQLLDCKNFHSSIDNPKDWLASLKGSTLYQARIPDKYINKHYGSLFQDFSSRGIIPLGLYRGVNKHIHIGRRMNRVPFVYTNPAKNTEIFVGDKVFILAPKQITSFDGLLAAAKAAADANELKLVKLRGSQR